MGICVIICKKSMIYGKCIPLSAGIYDTIFVNTLPFMPLLIFVFQKFYLRFLFFHLGKQFLGIWQNVEQLG
jgi:hypothetical protein